MKSSEILLLSMLGLAAVFAIYARRRYWGDGTPLRQWFETHMRARLKSLVMVVFYITVAVWLVIWATAEKEGKFDFFREAQELFPKKPEKTETPAKTPSPTN